MTAFLFVYQDISKSRRRSSYPPVGLLEHSLAPSATRLTAMAVVSSTGLIPKRGSKPAMRVSSEGSLL